MQNDLSIFLWMGGMLFGLAAFAVKVGFGLALGRCGGKGTVATLGVYLLLFVIIAAFSGVIMDFFGPILRKGPYLHGIMAAGMAAWGIVTLKGIAKGATEKNPYGEDDVHSHTHPLSGSFLLLVPCPVCLTAMAFSTWTALSVVRAPAGLLGLGLGLSFCIMTLLVVVLVRMRRTEHPETALGLVMITLGLYFAAALFLPAKIEEARAMYMAKAKEVIPLVSRDVLGIMTVLAFCILVGFVVGAKKGVSR